jgi:sphingosine kinase
MDQEKEMEGPSDMYEVVLNKRTAMLSISDVCLQITTKSDKIEHPWFEVLCAVQSSESTLEIKVYSITQKNPHLTTYLIQVDSPIHIIQRIEDHLFDPWMEEKRKKRFKVIINPISGRRKAMKRWTLVQGMFAGCEIEVEYTQFRGHATEIAKSLKAPYDGIIVVSGDGLVHEVINGLCDENSRSIRKTPVGVIAAGSGNALAKHLCSLINKPVSAETCAYICLKGTPNGIDISKVAFEHSRPIYSFLSVSWAYIADVDIESDRFRCCGFIRYYIYGLWRYLKLRRYTGTLSWRTNEEFESCSGVFTYFLASSLPFVGETMMFAPLAKHDDGMHDVLFMGNASRMQILKVLLTMDSGKHLDSKGLEYFKTDSWRLEPNGGIFSIDGDYYEIGNIDVTVMRKFCNVLMINS